MSKAELSHSHDEIKKRRQDVPYFIDPKEVKPKEDIRVRAWAAAVMSKHEHLFNPKKHHDRAIVAKSGVEPEAIDIRQIYPFPGLNWIIYRNKNLWSIMLRSQHRILANIDFAQI